MSYRNAQLAQSQSCMHNHPCQMCNISQSHPTKVLMHNRRCQCAILHTQRGVRHPVISHQRNAGLSFKFLSLCGLSIELRISMIQITSSAFFRRLVMVRGPGIIVIEFRFESLQQWPGADQPGQRTCATSLPGYCYRIMAQYRAPTYYTSSLAHRLQPMMVELLE